MSDTNLAASLIITDQAQLVLRTIEQNRDEAVAIELNDGCCDGMGPVALDASMVGTNDIHIGSDDGTDVYATRTKSNLEAYDIIIDVNKVENVGSFSLEVPYGYRLTADEQRIEPIS